MKDIVINMETIENEILKVSVNPLGGEISSIIDKRTGKELFYDGRGSWHCQDHILFPFIGPCKDYVINGKHYSCPTQHGFVRTSTLKTVSNSVSSLILSMEDSDETRKIFPFSFVLHVTYKLSSNSLERKYEVINRGKEEIPFSLGDHAAYKIRFGKAKLCIGTRDRYLPRKEDFLLHEEEKFDKGPMYLLSREDFHKYETIVLINDNSPLYLITVEGERITYDFNSPYIAIWSAGKEEDNFVCVEPWWGLPPYYGMKEEVKDRKDINISKETLELSDKTSFNLI